MQGLQAPVCRTKLRCAAASRMQACRALHAEELAKGASQADKH